MHPLPQAVDLNEFEKHDFRAWVASLLSEMRVSGREVARA
jgi:hypothetical protein